MLVVLQRDHVERLHVDDLGVEGHVLAVTPLGDDLLRVLDLDRLLDDATELLPRIAVEVVLPEVLLLTVVELHQDLVLACHRDAGLLSPVGEVAVAADDGSETALLKQNRYVLDHHPLRTAIWRARSMRS